MTLKTDVLIIGSGPVGLAAALGLARQGLFCTVIEKQPEEKVAEPADDGREIALTHRSVGFLQDLKVWDDIARHPLGQIKTAHVLNRRFSSPLSFTSEGTGKDRLSRMVPNRLIRQTLYNATRCEKNIAIRFGCEVTGVETTEAGGRVTLDNGLVIDARLVIAADSRVSPARAMMGIDVEKLDFKKTMIVSKMAQEKPHNDTAYEWFQADRTLAILPLAGNYSSAVLTVEHEEAEKLLALDDAAYAKQIESWFDARHGAFTAAGRRNAYPLGANYAKKFYGPSFILMGDAAVGMHPVTAHGFNFGLRGVATLVDIVRAAQGREQDWAAPALLAQYNRLQRLATRPLYLATNFIASLYTRRGPLSVIARHGLHALARKVPFARQLINRQLVDSGKT